MNCRHCDATLHRTFLDLGHAPLSNAYLDHASLAASAMSHCMRLFRLAPRGSKVAWCRFWSIRRRRAGPSWDTVRLPKATRYSTMDASNPICCRSCVMPDQPSGAVYVVMLEYCFEEVLGRPRHNRSVCYSALSKQTFVRGMKQRSICHSTPSTVIRGSARPAVRKPLSSMSAHSCQKYMRLGLAKL